MTKEQLMQLKTKLEGKRIERATKSGQLDAEKKKLKEEWGVASAGAAKKKIEDMNNELEGIATEFDEGVDALKREYSSLLEA